MRGGFAKAFRTFCLNIPSPIESIITISTFFNKHKSKNIEKC